MKIQQALKTLLSGRTAIMITHRLSTIREADNIIVLDHGSIMEQGDHEQLMERQGVYYGLVKAQFNMLEMGKSYRFRTRIIVFSDLYLKAPKKGTFPFRKKG